MTEERGRAAAAEGARPHGAPPDGSPRCHPPGPPRAPPDVRFITEERFDFSVLSPADSREEDEEDEESPGGVRWSPLSGAQLEEMVREATRLAAQLQHSHLPPLGPGPSPPGGGGSPRNPRRETFVVKDSPVRELLPTVPPAREDTPGCHPPPAPKGPPARGRGTLARGGPSRLCPPRGAGAAARGRSEPLRKGPAGQPKARGGAAAAPPTRAPRARATTAAVPVPSSRPPHPVPSPSPPPAGLGRWGRHQAGGPPRGPAWWHREVQGRPLGGLVQGAEQPPPAAACAPPGRRRPAAPCGDGVGAPGETEARGGRGQQCPPPLPPKGGGRGSGWILL
eukprot:XP_027299369.1 proline/serine-rich coiled-coil protein 1 isoform X2 [Anas platyrhynchos]